MALLVLAAVLSPSHPRKIDFLYFDESLIVLTTHPRELRLERE